MISTSPPVATLLSDFQAGLCNEVIVNQLRNGTFAAEYYDQGTHVESATVSEADGRLLYKDLHGAFNNLHLNAGKINSTIRVQKVRMEIEVDHKPVIAMRMRILR